MREPMRHAGGPSSWILWRMAFLARLLDLLFDARADARLVEAMRQDALSMRVSPTRVASTNPVTIALMPFTGAAAAAIREAKYHASPKAREALAEALAAYLLELGGSAMDEVLLVPVPLSASRRRERGFNQCEVVARDALARHAFARIGIAPGILARTHDTKVQALAAREERGKDLAFAFEARGPLDPHGTYLLLDDVITTGATMRGAIEALTRAGAMRILPVALAHANGNDAKSGLG